MRPQQELHADWQEFDRGPGYFSIPPGLAVRVRLKSIGDEDLQVLAQELQDFPALYSLDLSENRNISDTGLRSMKLLPQIKELSLSSTNISGRGLEYLGGLNNLERLNLSYCNHLTDSAVKTLRALTSLEHLDLQGCLSITKAGVNKVQRRKLTILR